MFLTYFNIVTSCYYSNSNLLAKNERFLPVYPDPDNAPISVVVVVAGCADASPDEPEVGEDRAQPYAIGRTYSSSDM